MNKEIHEVLIRPLLTERSVFLKDKENRYSFEVAKNVNKIEVRQAVEKFFKVKVKKVRTSIVNGKVRKMGRFEGQRPDWKKAIVTLAPGQKMNVTEIS